MKKDLLFGVIDQGLQSVINLVVGLVLINYDSKSNYGLYGIGIATILLVVGFSNALVSTQMTVLSPYKEDRQLFCSSLIVGFYLLFIPIIIIFLSGYELLKYCYSIELGGYYVYALTITAPIIVFIEIMRRYYYLKLLPGKALLMDVFYVSLYLYGLFYIVTNDLDEKYICVVIANGLAALISSVIFFLLSDLKLRGSVKAAISNFRMAWEGGRWALGGVIVTWLQNQGYTYILGFSKGSGVVAEANAARLFLSPINVISTSITKVIMPRVVKLKVNKNIKKAILKTRMVLYFILIFIVLYVLVLNIYMDLIKKYFSLNEYAAISSIVLLWSVYFLCQAFRNNNSILLQVFRMFKCITLYNTVSSVIVLGVGYLAVLNYEVEGLIVVMSAGEVILALFFWKAFNDKRIEN